MEIINTMDSIKITFEITNIITSFSTTASIPSHLSQLLHALSLTSGKHGVTGSYNVSLTLSFLSPGALSPWSWFLQIPW